MTGALDGIRVADFGRYIAGPYCGSLLADLGAEVIRVERVGGGDDRFVVELGENDAGANFLQCNRNKKSLTLDPGSPQGRAIMARLIATSDVVIANLPPQSLVAMGLDYESLKRIKADIILTTVNAFGSGGPWSNRVGFDGVAQAMSGLVYMTGRPGDPMKAYGPWVDFAAGSLAAFATVAALRHRDRTGEGQLIEAPMLLAAMTPATTLLMEQAVLGTNRGPTANRSQVSAPADMFATRDGHIIVQVVSQPLYKRWAKLMGEDLWLTDPRFADDNTRLVHAEILSERMRRWCAERTTEEALDALDKASLPAGPVLSPQQVLDNVHVQATAAFQPVSYPGVPAPAPLLRTPVHLSATPGTIRTPPPLPGEHADAVLGDLGYSAEEIATFRANSVI